LPFKEMVLNGLWYVLRVLDKTVYKHTSHKLHSVMLQEY